MESLDHQSSCEEMKLRYEEALSRLCLITRLNEAISLVENLPELCIHLLDTVIDFTSAENCSIMLNDSDTQCLNLVVARGRDDRGSFFGGDKLSTTFFACGEGAAGWAAQKKELVSIDDCEADERFIRLEKASTKVNSVICAPIVADGAVIGVINCSHPKKKQFSDRDRENVMLMAGQAAAVLQRAFAVEKLRKEQKDLNRKLAEKNEILSSMEQSQEQLRSQLYRSEKFAALGELLAGVAHEINNRIAPILIYSQMLLQQAADEKDERRLRIIEESAIGAKAILETFLHYSRSGTRECVNLNQTLQKTLTLTEYKLRNAGIELELDLCPELPPTTVNEKQMAQVFLNILNNAVCAMEPKGGKLSITSTYGSNSVKFYISDTGPGVQKEIVTKIFDPFFTTKDPGKGTGLGLSISRRYVEEHNGSIGVDPKCRSGACFVIEIPRTEPVQAEPELDGVPMDSEAAARILVVDDDSTICDVIRDVLGPCYEIEFANDGRTATDKIQNLQFDLLVVDYHMPGFDGKQLYEWVADNHPSLKDRIIFSTGDIYHNEIRDFIDGTGCRSLIKPFSTADLRDIVSGVLDA